MLNLLVSCGAVGATAIVIALLGWRFERIERQFALLERTIRKEGGQIMATIQDLMTAITDLQAKVAAEQTVEQSAITLLQGLNQALKDALATSDVSQAISAVQAVSAQIDSDTQALATAVTANTVAPEVKTPPT